MPLKLRLYLWHTQDTILHALYTIKMLLNESSGTVYNFLLLYYYFIF